MLSIISVVVGVIGVVGSVWLYVLDYSGGFKYNVYSCLFQFFINLFIGMRLIQYGMIERNLFVFNDKFILFMLGISIGITIYRIVERNVRHKNDKEV